MSNAYYGAGVAETTCEECRIEISKDGIEIDGSTGDLASEALVLVFIVFVVAGVYVAKKWVDSKFK
jgi:hypothetical protein|tara:strand:+ start:159 stop:356 length:198 start_codon:yes stop_codon:yes gene_type:complete